MIPIKKVFQGFNQAFKAEQIDYLAHKIKLHPISSKIGNQELISETGIKEFSQVRNVLQA